MKRAITKESKDEIHKAVLEYLLQNRLLKTASASESSSFDEILTTESAKQQLFNFVSERYLPHSLPSLIRSRFGVESLNAEEDWEVATLNQLYSDILDKQSSQSKKSHHIPKSKSEQREIIKPLLDAPLGTSNPTKTNLFRGKLHILHFGRQMV